MDTSDARKFLSSEMPLLQSDIAEMQDYVVVQIAIHIKSLPKPKKKRVAVIKYTDQHLSFAKFMYEKIRIVAPHTKEPNFDKWAETVRLLNNDVTDFYVIESTWAFIQGDDFWRSVVLSPTNLRKNFARIHAAHKSFRPKIEAPSPMSNLTDTAWAAGMLNNQGGTDHES